MPLFSKPDPKKQMRQNERDLRRTERELARDRAHLERGEHDLEAQIKQAAKKGDRQTATVLAKQLVRMREQKAKSYKMEGTIRSVGYQQKAMQSNKVLAGSMAATTKTMGAMNAQLNPEQMAQTMKKFQEENMKMEMTEEMINDTMDDIFEDDDEEADAVVNQVLDEIGIEISGKLADAPAAGRGKLPAAQESTGISDKELEKQLADLKGL